MQLVWQHPLYVWLLLRGLQGCTLLFFAPDHDVELGTLEQSYQGVMLIFSPALMQGLSMLREINLIYHPDFSHEEILRDISRMYNETAHLYQ